MLLGFSLYFPFHNIQLEMCRFGMNCWPCTGNWERKFKYFRLGNQSPDPVLRTETPEGHFEMSVVLNVGSRT
jgi:hypothetical protein